ncbi:MAG: molybdopterin-guanine dinucleotide biosynthesis protein B [Deltaproteobacteria bacterium]
MKGRRRRPVPILAFVGRHDSGKTTLIREVARELRSRGHRIAVIKSTKHDIPPSDTPGTDTGLFLEDGIGSVALVGPSTIRLVQENTREPLVELAARLFPGRDLVIAEGFKHCPDIPKIEVWRAGLRERPLFGSVPGVVAIVSDVAMEEGGIRCISRFDVTAVVEFIEGFIRL